MKARMSENIRKMRSDPNGLKALSDFMATAKLHERRVITYQDQQGRQITISLKRGGL